MTADDLRLLLGQQIGLPWVATLATELLEIEPMLEASYYPGDLLLQVLRLPESFWAGEWQLRERICELARRALDSPSLNEMPKDAHSELERFAQQ